MLNNTQFLENRSKFLFNRKVDMLELSIKQYV